MIFQPLMPIPLAEGWKVIVRPSVPIQFVQPQPDRQSSGDTYDYRAGLSDVLLPLTVSPEAGHWRAHQAQRDPGHRINDQEAALLKPNGR